MTENTQIMLPKIKKLELKHKVLLDPADFRKGIPKSKLPQLNSKGLILSLEPHIPNISKVDNEGNLKVKLTYTAQVLTLHNRYIEVMVNEDEKEEKWIGQFYGINVRGSGGEGRVRGCKVVKIYDNYVVVQAVSQGGMEQWKKIAKKIEFLLEQIQ